MTKRPVPPPGKQEQDRQPLATLCGSLGQRQEQCEDGAARPKSEQAEQLPHGTEHILFVDDEVILAELGREILNELGYTVTTISGSSEALELFSVHPQAYDLVITDMNMPGLSGLDLAKEMLSVRKETPIILYTGFCKDSLRKKAEAIGIRQVVMKPYDVSNLAQAIRLTLGKGKGR